MKKIAVAPLVALFVVLSSACAFAQDLILDSGFTQQSLANVQAATAGFDFDSAGNIYYIGEQDSDSADTQVIEMTKASGYSSSTIIADYGTATYGSFLTLQGSTLYYGDSVNGGNINSTTLPVLTPQSPTVVANMPDNYDMAFSGTSAFVSADIAGAAEFLPENGVYALSLTTGTYQQILATGDYSGPIAFTSNGDLLYGTSGYGLYGIYEFTPAQVNAAITSGTALQLTQGDLIISNSGNSDFVVVGNDLFDAFNPFSQTGEVSTLTEYNLQTDAVTKIGSLTNDALYFSGMAYLNGDLTVADTDGATYTDFIQIAPVPEPRAGWLCIAGLILVIVFHERRPCRKLDSIT